MRLLFAATLCALAACVVPPPTAAQPLDGGTADGGAPAPAPIDALEESWTWVDFPDTACGNGQPTGLGVNLTSRSTDVVVYLEGGGACWDVNTCFVLKSAVNIDTGYTSASFAGDAVKTAAAFDRTDGANPFRDASFVLIPYCTGDLHAGTQVTTYTALGLSAQVHHVGALNVEAYLRRLAATFPNARRVFVTGSSAGGYGAQLDYERFAAAFPAAEVHLLADSAQAVQPYDSRFADMRRSWNLQPPPRCIGCDTSLPAWAEYLHTTYPTRRFGLLAFDADQTISLYFGYPLDGSFKAATDALLLQHYDPHPNARYFVLSGTSHTMLGGFATLTGADGLPLRTWIARWMSGDPQWANDR